METELNNDLEKITSQLDLIADKNNETIRSHGIAQEVYQMKSDKSVKELAQTKVVYHASL